MAKRKRYKAVVDPVLKASLVVSTYVSKWEDKEKRKEWLGNYEGQIDAYTKDDFKQQRAIVALAGYYAGFTPDVKEEIRKAVNKAIANKDEALAKFMKVAQEKGLKPVVPSKASELAKKVSELLTIPVPTTRPTTVE